MNRKICCLLSAMLLNVWLSGIVYAKVDVSGSDSNYLRIFTPYHNIKSVFSEYENKKSLDLKRQLTDDEIKLIAGIVHAESNGEPFEGKIGVAAVILNRVYHPQFPKSVEGVVYQKNAFSCVVNGCFSAEPDIDSYDAVIEALKGNDPTNNAVFFYNPRTASSKWMINAVKDQPVTIGSHVFFK